MRLNTGTISQKNSTKPKAQAKSLAWIIQRALFSSSSLEVPTVQEKNASIDSTTEIAFEEFVHHLFLNSLTKYLTSKCPDEHVKHHHMMENVDGTLLQSCHTAPSQTSLGMIFQSGAIGIDVLSIRSTSGHFLDSSLQGLQKYPKNIYSRERAHYFIHNSSSEQMF